MPRLRVLVAHGDARSLAALSRALEPGHAVSHGCATVAELVAAAHAAPPDLIVTGITFPDGDALDAVIALGHRRPVPAVIVTSRRSMDLVTKAMQDHVMAYLIEPVAPEELQAAVIVAWSRFEQLVELEEQVGDLKRALESRKLVERAKGVLMSSEGISEQEAFARLRRAAQDERVKINAIAERTLADLDRPAE